MDFSSFEEGLINTGNQNSHDYYNTTPSEFVNTPGSNLDR